jgi:hypothetical protein
MCGGPSCKWKVPKHLFIYKGTPIVKRTIDLLKKSGIKVSDIAITTSPDCVEKYAQFGVEVIPYEAHNKPFFWLDAFYPTYDPVCYLFGDVVYSSKAIKTIVKTKTDSIEFFASAPPFAPNYPKKWAEPFAFKVVDQDTFRRCIQTARENKNQHVWYRHPITWELWQVIKGTPPNKIIYTNYTAINDYTCDVDNAKELKQWEKRTT